MCLWNESLFLDGLKMVRCCFLSSIRQQKKLALAFYLPHFHIIKPPHLAKGRDKNLLCSGSSWTHICVFVNFRVSLTVFRKFHVHVSGEKKIFLVSLLTLFRYRTAPNESVSNFLYIKSRKWCEWDHSLVKVLTPFRCGWSRQEADHEFTLSTCSLVTVSMLVH